MRQRSLDDLTSTTTAIQKFEELSNAVTALPTGPLTQYVEGFKERWGIDISDEKVAQRAILQGATNQLLQARSGAAISEGEYQRLLKELPNEGLDPKVFKARLANTVRQFKNLYKTKVQILRKTGHAIPDDLMEPSQHQRRHHQSRAARWTNLRPSKSHECHFCPLQARRSHISTGAMQRDLH